MIPKFSFWEGSATLKANEEDLNIHVNNMTDSVTAIYTQKNVTVFRVLAPCKSLLYDGI
jgi:hypothetical protein